MAAWEAVTASDPNRLLSFLAAREPRLPFLRRSLLALLHHYPDLKTGLNAWEYQLLRYTASGTASTTGLAVSIWIPRTAASGFSRPYLGSRSLTGATDGSACCAVDSNG